MMKTRKKRKGKNAVPSKTAFFSTDRVEQSGGQETAAEQMREKKEAVDETIRELRSEKQPAQAKRPLYLTILMWAFLPITLFVFLIMHAAKKVKVPIAIKMLVIFGTMFLLLIGAYSFYIIISLKGTLEQTEETVKLINSLTVSSVILIAVFTVVFVALITVATTLLLNPIRKITVKVNSFSTENLSARLEIIDTQDELMELTNCINGMLSSIEESFVRQQNFVADASHELKTPISVIQGYSNMLKRWGKDDPAILSEGIASIANESENMKRIVEQLLFLARLGKMNVNRTVFSLSDELNKMVDGYRLTDLAHEITLSTEAIDLNTDKNLLLESIRALVDNAIKYTPSGGKISLVCESDEASIRIKVIDTGIGIAAEDLPKIFDRFYRCDKSRGREKGSSGLGLTIAKSIVETLGGILHVKTTLGEGSEFTIELF